MGVAKKYLYILLVTFVGQIIIQLLVERMSKGAELGIFLIYPVVVIFGIFIQVIIIFFIIKDTILSRIAYSVIGLLASIFMIFFLGFLHNLIYSQEIEQYKKNQEIAEYCMNQSINFEQQAGFKNITTQDPRFKQIVQESMQKEKNCLQEKGYVQDAKLCTYLICFR